MHQAIQAAEQQQEEWQTANASRRTPEQPLQGPEPQGPAARRRAGVATDAAEVEPEAEPSSGEVATGGPTVGRRGRKRGNQSHQRMRERYKERSRAAAAPGTQE